MKHSLIENYLFYLKNSKFASSKQEELANKLIKTVPEAKSVSDLKNLFSDSLKSLNVNWFSFFCNFTPIFNFCTNSEEETPVLNKQGRLRDLVTLLDGWISRLEQQMIFEASAREKLNNLPSQQEPKVLINLLHEVLGNPDALMHSSMYEIVEQLNSNNLKEALDQLAHLPPSSKVRNSRSGDFTSQVPINLNHEGCLSLLANSSAAYVYNERDAHLKLTNGLLQTVLILYSDLHAPKPKEVLAPDTSEKFTSFSRKNSCPW